MGDTPAPKSTETPHNCRSPPIATIVGRGEAVLDHVFLFQSPKAEVFVLKSIFLRISPATCSGTFDSKLAMKAALNAGHADPGVAANDATAATAVAAISASLIMLMATSLESGT